MKDLESRFHTEKPQKLTDMKSEVVFTNYLKWLEDLARKQLAYNDALQLVSNRISNQEIKRHRKEGRLSVSSKVEQIYKLNSDRFDENYEDTDFDILYDC